MIYIKNSHVHPILHTEGTLNYEEKNMILYNLDYVQEIFRYDSLEELAFELALRTAIISASYRLLDSNLVFEVFDKAKCNPKFWTLTSNGGFLLKKNVKPADAIRDIFKNGELYATECATAMIIVLYGALLDVYSDETFNKLFPDILLYTWNYNKHLALETRTYGSTIIGDIVYFKNPQVNPSTPEWQGENVVYLGNNYYFGHGLGIKSAYEIIFYLNLKRIPMAFVSAYLTELNTRLNMKEMYPYIDKSKVNTNLHFTSMRHECVLITIGQNTFAF